MNQKPYTFIIIGRSGSGKGTQLTLLREYFEKNNPQTKTQAYICGDAFREFFKNENYLSSLVKDSVNAGNYQPDFLATTLLFSKIFNSINNTDTLFFDGYPRSLEQLKELKELLKYTQRENPIFIDVSVSEEEVTRRMLLRGRSDDTIEGVAKRQGEFTRAIVPMIELIKSDPDFTYVTVNGMPSPEEVHNNILEALKKII